MRLILLLTIIIFSSAAVAQTPELSNQIIVKLKKEASVNIDKINHAPLNFGNDVIDNVNHKHSITGFYKINTGRDSTNVLYTIQYPDGADLKSIINEFDATGMFDYAEPDYIGHAAGVMGRAVAMTGTPNEPTIQSPLPPSPDITPNDSLFSR